MSDGDVHDIWSDCLQFSPSSFKTLLSLFKIYLEIHFCDIDQI